MTAEYGLPFLPKEPWMDQGSCHQGDIDRRLFFPYGKIAAHVRRYIQRTCAECPVTDNCLEYSLRHRIADGVWGGVFEDERAEFQREYDKVAVSITHTGNQHLPLDSPQSPTVLSGHG